jgi:hypothetical protein
LVSGFRIIFLVFLSVSFILPRQLKPKRPDQQHLTCVFILQRLSAGLTLKVPFENYKKRRQPSFQKFCFWPAADRPQSGLNRPAGRPD